MKRFRYVNQGFFLRTPKTDITFTRKSIQVKYGENEEYFYCRFEYPIGKSLDSLKSFKIERDHELYLTAIITDAPIHEIYIDSVFITDLFDSRDRIEELETLIKEVIGFDIFEYL